MIIKWFVKIIKNKIRWTVSKINKWITNYYFIIHMRQLLKYYHTYMIKYYLVIPELRCFDFCIAFFHDLPFSWILSGNFSTCLSNSKSSYLLDTYKSRARKMTRLLPISNRPCNTNFCFFHLCLFFVIFFFMFFKVFQGILFWLQLISVKFLLNIRVIELKFCAWMYWYW